MKSVLASGVAYSTEPTLMADTDRVLLVGELKTLRLHVVEAGDGSADTGVVLETTFYSSVHSTTLYLSNFHFESSLKTARGDEGERGWRITRASINVHVLASVPAADDGYRSSSSHNKPDTGTVDKVVFSCMYFTAHLSEVHWCVTGSGWVRSISSRSNLNWHTSVLTFSTEIEHCPMVLKVEG